VCVLHSSERNLKSLHLKIFTCTFIYGEIAFYRVSTNPSSCISSLKRFLSWCNWLVFLTLSLFLRVFGVCVCINNNHNFRLKKKLLFLKRPTTSTRVELWLFSHSFLKQLSLSLSFCNILFNSSTKHFKMKTLLQERKWSFPKLTHSHIANNIATHSYPQEDKQLNRQDRGNFSDCQSLYKSPEAPKISLSNYKG